MFSWWANCTFNSKTKILQKEYEKMKKERLAAEAECEALRATMNSDGREADALKQLDDMNARMAEIKAEQDLIQVDIEAEKRRIAELEAKLKTEKDGRKADKAMRDKLSEQLKTVTEDKKSLEAELALIVDQIGFLSEYSTKKQN